MKTNTFAYIGVALIIIVTIFVSTANILHIYKNAYIPEEERYSTEQYCVVEDKYTKTVMIGKTPSVKHCIVVYVNDSADLKDTIVVPNSIYNEIEVGMEIKCVITYTEDELVSIDFVSQ